MLLYARTKDMVEAQRRARRRVWMKIETKLEELGLVLPEPA